MVPEHLTDTGRLRPRNSRKMTGLSVFGPSAAASASADRNLLPGIDLVTWEESSLKEPDFPATWTRITLEDNA